MLNFFSYKTRTLAFVENVPKNKDKTDESAVVYFQSYPWLFLTSIDVKYRQQIRLFS